MNQIQEKLKIYYESVENSKTLREFLTNLEDYVNFIKETPEFRLAIEKLEEEIEKKRKEMRNVENQAVEESKKAAKELLNFLRKVIKNIELTLKRKTDIKSFEQLEDDLKHYKRIEKRLKNYIKAERKRVDPENFINMHYKLVWLDRRLPWPPCPKILTDFLEFKNKINEEKKNKLWGCWGYLRIFPIINELNDNEFNQFCLNSVEEGTKENKMVSDLFVGDLLVIREKILEEKKNEAIRNYPFYTINGRSKLLERLGIKKFTESELVIDYLMYSERIYKYLISFISKEETSISRNSLKSIHLLANKLIGDQLDIVNTIFLVLDEHFEMPIRCAVKNRNGEPTYIKKLYDIAYFVNAPGKQVHYDKKLADCINNRLFKRKMVAQYMKTNKLKKPTLVKKSEDGKYLVLTNEVLVKTGLVKNIVPSQYQSLYKEENVKYFY